MNLLAATWWIAKKDLRAYFRDRTGMLLGLLLPIALVTVFGMVMQFAFGGGSGMPKVELWVVDDDESEASRRFVAALRDSGMLTVRPRAGEQPAEAHQVRQAVLDGESHHALFIAAGYGQAIARGDDPALRLVRDPGRTMEARLVGIALLQATMAASEGKSMPWLLASMMRRQGMSEDGVARVRAAMDLVQGVIDRFVGGDAELRTPDRSPAAAFDLASMFEGMVPVTHEDVQPPSRPKNLGYQLAQSVAGMTVMMLMFGLMACSVTLLQERDQGTLRRLLVSRAPRASLLLGKFAFCVLVGLLQLAILFGYGEVVFAVGAFRDPVTLLVLSLTWAAAATSFGMLVAVWARTQKQAEGLATLLILVMAALGGCWFPIQIAELPWWAEGITRATITHWAMTGFQGMFWSQKSFTDPVLLRAIAVQWAFAIVAAGVAWRLWRRRFVGG
jgi:ABC-2 type transport system permease protein